MSRPLAAVTAATPPWEVFGWAALATALAMALLWWLLRRIGRASLVDVAWSAALGLLALLYAAVGPGWGPRRALLAGLVLIWSARLALHLARRIRRDGEDGRYQAMHAAAGTREALFSFIFFQAQALAAIAFSLPFLVIASDGATGFRALEFAGVALWIVAFAGEVIADRQLDAWKRDPAHAGRTCRHGLWAWSRHPNYFCEWLLWCAYALIGWGAPLGWINALAAVAMLVMVLKVSGIPHTEAQALRSRGEDYREYQRTTPAFFPRPPRD